MKNKKLSSAFGAALALAVLASACGSASKSATPTTPVSTPGPTADSSSTNTASDTGVTATTVKLGLLASLTGTAASTFADSEAGALARIDLQNAQGGVDGRQLELVTTDDQSSASIDLTAAQDLVQKGVFGVVNDAITAQSGERYFQQHGIPMTGTSSLGGAFGVAPYTNMFSYNPPTATPFNGKLYNYDYFGTFLHQIGVTKLAGLAYDISPSSQDSIKAAFAGGASHGVSNCYANYSVPFGGVDFTADALSIKGAGCNGVAGSFVDASDVALATALAQGGVKSKNL
jgi:branched-chain amino acid transport system substrate-binding protein